VVDALLALTGGAALADDVTVLAVQTRA
jgi:hypothetical protein